MSSEILPSAMGYAVYKLGSNEMICWIDLDAVDSIRNNNSFWMKRCTYGQYLRDKQGSDPASD